MDRYQVARLIGWAGTLRTRKRMQKVVYLLQSAGCPYQAEYRLLHVGPYSAELAGLTDELVRAGVLAEHKNGRAAGCTYDYSLTAWGGAAVVRFEESSHGTAVQELALYRPFAVELLGRDVRELEYAATIAYFKNRGSGFDEALARASEFVQPPLDFPIAVHARQLAERCIDVSLAQLP